MFSSSTFPYISSVICKKLCEYLKCISCQCSNLFSQYIIDLTVSFCRQEKRNIFFQNFPSIFQVVRNLSWIVIQVKFFKESFFFLFWEKVLWNTCGNSSHILQREFFFFLFWEKVLWNTCGGYMKKWHEFWSRL